MNSHAFLKVALILYAALLFFSVYAAGAEANGGDRIMPRNGKDRIQQAFSEGFFLQLNATGESAEKVEKSSVPDGWERDERDGDDATQNGFIGCDWNVPRRYAWGVDIRGWRWAFISAAASLAIAVVDGARRLRRRLNSPEHRRYVAAVKYLRHFSRGVSEDVSAMEMTELKDALLAWYGFDAGVPFSKVIEHSVGDNPLLTNAFRELECARFAPKGRIHGRMLRKLLRRLCILWMLIACTACWASDDCGYWGQMTAFASEGRYEEAIAVGEKWSEEHSSSELSECMASLCEVDGQIDDADAWREHSRLFGEVFRGRLPGTGMLPELMVPVCVPLFVFGLYALVLGKHRFGCWLLGAAVLLAGVTMAEILHRLELEHMAVVVGEKTMLLTPEPSGMELFKLRNESVCLKDGIVVNGFRRVSVNGKIGWLPEDTHILRYQIRN